MKKIISVLLAMSLAISLAAFGASAYDEPEEDCLIGSPKAQHEIDPDFGAGCSYRCGGTKWWIQAGIHYQFFCTCTTPKTEPNTNNGGNSGTTNGGNSDEEYYDEEYYNDDILEEAFPEVELDFAIPALP